MSASKIVKLDISKRSAEVSSILSRADGIANDLLNRLLRNMLDNADDTLFALADKAQTDQKQNAYFDAMRALRITRGDIETIFREQNNRHCADFLDGKISMPTTTATASLDDADSLSLVDDTALEESLAVTGMIEKSKNRLARDLYAIERRYQVLLDRPDLTLDAIPITPAPICHAFDTPVRALNAEIEIKLIIYKLFDRDVLTHLGNLYDKINALLISEGIMPVLRMANSNQNNNDSINAPPAPLPEGVINGQDGAGSGNASLAALRSLLNPQSGPQPGGGGGMGAGMMAAIPGFDMPAVDSPDIDGSALLDVISGLQRLDMSSSTVILKEKVARLSASGQLRSVDRDVICIVEMLFDYILEDPALPACARALIGRLQIPMIRLSLHDNTVFEDKQHPARRLINVMARSTVGLSDSESEDSPLIARIGKIVEHICQRFNEENLSIFADSLADFETFLADEDASAEEQENALLQQRQERERHAISVAWVNSEIASMIHGHCLPRPVFDIINGPWNQVMLEAYLDGGQDGQQWKECVRFVEILIDSVEPENGRFDSQRLGQIVPHIVRTLRSEFSRIDYPGDQLESLLQGLEAVHIAALKGKRQDDIGGVQIKKAMPDGEQGRAEDDPFSGLENFDIFADEGAPGADEEPAPSTTEFMQALFGGDIEEIVIGHEQEAVRPEIDDQAWAIVQGLRPGQWISMTGENGKQQRMKLAWKSDMIGETTFMNWRCKISADLGFNELAAKFRNGEAMLVESLPVFERAVDALMNSLQKHA